MFSFEFMRYLDSKVGFSIRKHRREDDTNETVVDRVAKEIENLSIPELFGYFECYLEENYQKKEV